MSAAYYVSETSTKPLNAFGRQGELPRMTGGRAAAATDNAATRLSGRSARHDLLRNSNHQFSVIIGGGGGAFFFSFHAWERSSSFRSSLAARKIATDWTLQILRHEMNGIFLPNQGTSSVLRRS